MALGVNYLHTRRPPLLHRDLKSPNVLLSEEGVAKIADVGMVRSQVKELVTAQPVMTPLWAAPEVRRGGAVAAWCCAARSGCFATGCWSARLGLLPPLSPPFLCTPSSLTVSPPPQVMRHDRASVKADIWSYGVLVWELVSGADITEHQPLAISRQMGGGGGGKGRVMALPPNCPPVARKIFERCTALLPDARPSSQDIVEWLREA